MQARAISSTEHKPIRTEEEAAADHVAQWRAWWAALTPDRQAEYVAAGITAPENPHKRRRKKREEGEETEAPKGWETKAALEQYEQTLRTEREPIDPDKRRDLVLLAQTLPHIADAANPRLEASTLALALKVGARQGITVGELAHQHLIEHDDVHRAVRGWAVRLDVCRADVELLCYVIAPILKSQTPGLEAETIAMAASVGINRAVRMEDVGLKHGVCRAAISRRVREWVGKLSKRTGIEFPLPRACKRNTDAYRDSNVRRQAVDPFE